MVRVVTIQHRNVLDIVVEDGIYWVNPKNSYYERYKSSYEKMKQLMDDRLGVAIQPVWCFSKVNDMEPPTNIDWDYYEGKGCATSEDTVLLELDIDENIALTMNYYQWTDYMYFSEEGDEEGMKIALDNLFKLERADTIQVCLPYITKNMVLNVYNSGHEEIYHALDK